ncbi:MAG: hypothetical protein HQK53_01510 [Oligoflexia bacterium]|nr:hypothetical protein [Oligoflexia bacterium]
MKKITRLLICKIKGIKDTRDSMSIMDETFFNNIKSYLFFSILLVIIYNLLLVVATASALFVFSNLKETIDWSYSNRWLLLLVAKFFAIIGTYYYLKIKNFENSPGAILKKYIRKHLSIRTTLQWIYQQPDNYQILCAIIYLALITWLYPLGVKVLSSPNFASSIELPPYSFFYPGHIFVSLIFYSVDLLVITFIKENYPLLVLKNALICSFMLLTIFGITNYLIIPHPMDPVDPDFYYWNSLHFFTLVFLINISVPRSSPPYAIIALYLLLVAIPCSLFLGMGMVPSSLTNELGLITNFTAGHLSTNLHDKKWWPSGKIISYVLYWIIAYFYLIYYRCFRELKTRT